jgi:hypothetical protein
MNETMAGTFGSSTWIDPSVHYFDHALKAGFFHKFISALLRRSYCLLDLNSYPTEKRYGHSAGQREVNLDSIRGTEGRLNDFDERFHPLTERTRQRWQSIARAHEQGLDLPPVELIQVGEVYFVRDGHHRISVARAFGRTTITANVTVW